MQSHKLFRCLASTARVCILSKWLSFRVFTVSCMVVQWLHFKPRRSRSKHKSSGDVAGTAKKTHNTGNGKRIFFFNAFLNYLFLTAMGLRCCVWVLSGCGDWRLLSSCGARASCGGFFCCGLQAPERQLSSWWPLGLVAPGHKGSHFLDQRSSLCPPYRQAGGSALAGGVSTAGPLGKSQGFSLFEETLFPSEAQDWNVERCTKVAAAVQSAIHSAVSSETREKELHRSHPWVVFSGGQIKLNPARNQNPCRPRQV